MMRWVSILTLLSATIGCTERSAGPAETAPKTSPPAAFAGAWRSVTPSLEFIGLSVTAKAGVLGTRLTFSGVAWEGDGRIEGDSLVASMTIVGAPNASGVIVAHPRDAQTLRVQFRTAAAGPLELTFARED